MKNLYQDETLAEVHARLAAMTPAAERVRLGGLLGRFSSSGPAGCTTHEHTYFGKMTGEEWASVMYKHVDHHLRQFGA